MMKKSLSMGLSQQLTLLIGGVVLLLVLVSGALLLGLGYQNDRADAIQAQEGIACQVAADLSLYLQGQQDLLALAGSQALALPEGAAPMLDNLLSQQPALLEVAVLDAEGNLAAEGSRGDALRYLLGAEAGSPAEGISALALAEEAASPVFILRQPLPAGGESLAALDAGALPAIMQRVPLGENGRASILDGEGGLISGAGSNIVPAAFDSGGSIYNNAAGQSVVGAYCPVPGTSWLAVAEQPIADVSVAQSAERGLMLAVFIMMTGLIIFVMGYWLSRRVLLPLRVMAQGVEAIRRGNLAHRLNLQRGDELGELAQAFDQMTETLQKHNQELESLNSSLEERVQQRTQELEDSQRRMEAIAEVLYRTHERANAANRAKSQFVANMSHELRTPLNSMILINELFLRQTYGELTEKQQKKMRQSLESARMLLRLINDVLDISKIEAGELVVQRVPVDLMQLLRTSQDQIQPLIQGEVKFQLDVPPDLPQALGDAQRIQQILLNLLANAAKFTHQGHIRLRAWSLTIGKDHQPVEGNLPAGLSNPRAGNWVVVSVEDSGIGIPKDMHSLIFDQFKQVDDSNTRQYGGTGLGLAITKQLIEKQGGRIVVESEPGRGSTFSFMLARATSITREPATPPPG